MNPSLSAVEKLVTEHPSEFTPGLEKVVSLILAKGAQVFLVSGGTKAVRLVCAALRAELSSFCIGFRQMINPLAIRLNLDPATRVIANNLLFHSDGSFKGFDDQEPTSRSGGKGVALQGLIDEHGFNTVIMVGDGATDLEARAQGPADAFIGFGGVARREAVEAGADWFVTDWDGVIAALR